MVYHNSKRNYAQGSWYLVFMEGNPDTFRDDGFFPGIEY